MSLTHSIRRAIFVLGGILALAPGIAEAQAQPASDTLFRRAKRLVAEGNGAAGRALVDSVLRAAVEGTAPYGDALYWRGALAETAADAERDYRRVIVEYPLSAYADHALLAMADLESARGDRAGALQHLQRFVREHPATSPTRGTAALNAARLAFDQRDNKAGCAMVVAARVSTPTTNVEARNQIEYLATRCSSAELAGAVPVVGTTSAAASSAVSTPTIPVPTPTSTIAKADTSKPREKPIVTAPTPSKATPPQSPPAERPVPSTSARRGNYTIQLAAYNTRAEAERLVAKLKTKSVNARVSGESKPFRVRLDFYQTRQAAQDDVNALRARGIVGFVTTEGPTSPSAP
jgi:cell division protein FtsN